MLKIKDNVDLKELEKFGFEFDEFSNFWYHTSGLEIYFGNTNLELEIAWDTENFSLEECINILYDLIQAGLVEKVV